MGWLAKAPASRRVIRLLVVSFEEMPIPTRASDSFTFTRWDPDSPRNRQDRRRHERRPTHESTLAARPTGSWLRIRWSVVRIPPGAPLYVVYRHRTAHYILWLASIRLAFITNCQAPSARPRRGLTQASPKRDTCIHSRTFMRTREQAIPEGDERWISGIRSVRLQEHSMPESSRRSRAPANRSQVEM